MYALGISHNRVTRIDLEGSPPSLVYGEEPRSGLSHRTVRDAHAWSSGSPLVILCTSMTRAGVVVTAQGPPNVSYKVHLPAAARAADCVACSRFSDDGATFGVAAWCSETRVVHMGHVNHGAQALSAHCRMRVQAPIVGVHWLNPTSLLIVHSSGLDLAVLNRERTWRVTSSVTSRDLRGRAPRLKSNVSCVRVLPPTPVRDALVVVLVSDAQRCATSSGPIGGTACSARPPDQCGRAFAFPVNPDEDGKLHISPEPVTVQDFYWPAGGVVLGIGSSGLSLPYIKDGSVCMHGRSFELRDSLSPSCISTPVQHDTTPVAILGSDGRVVMFYDAETNPAGSKKHVRIPDTAYHTLAPNLSSLFSLRICDK